MSLSLIWTLIKGFKLWPLLAKYWKWVVAALVVVTYTLFVHNHGYNKADNKWKADEAVRLQAEAEAEALAQQELQNLLQSQADAQAERERQLLEDKQAAEQRATDALAEAQEQRRLNNETTRQLEALQIGDAVPLTDGVRELLSGSQEQIRSRRRS